MSNLDISLDDMIKKNKKSGAGGPNRPRDSGGPGPSRRFQNRTSHRTSPYVAARAPDTTWDHDLFADQTADYPAPATRVPPIQTGIKLFITNLDYGVSNEDIKELFSEAGDIKRYSVNYDRSGRSKGTAEVVFSRRRDAEVAVKKYNNVQLDGKPMKIEIVGTKTATAGPVNVAATFGNQHFAPRTQGRGGGVMGRLRGGNNMRMGGRGWGRGRASEKIPGKVSVDALDADLEKYHAEAMQTN